MSGLKCVSLVQSTRLHFKQMHQILRFCAVQFNINGNDLRIEGGTTLADCLKSNTTITRVRCEYICAGKQHSAPEAESAVQLHVL